MQPSMRAQSGNVLIIILIAVSLFAALAYAFTQGSRTNVGFVQSEMAKAESTKGSACNQAVGSAIKRLQLRGCTDISGETDPSLITDARCAIYHVQGGGVSPCNSTVFPACTITTIGGLCPDGSIYAGISPDGGKRMYIAPTDAPGTYMYGSGGIIRGTGNTSQGAQNTATLAAFGQAAHPGPFYCANLTANGHDDWYLPSIGELEIMFANKASLAGYGFVPGWFAWLSSTENAGGGDSWCVWIHGFHDGDTPHNCHGKEEANKRVRCVRKDL